MMVVWPTLQSQVENFINSVPQLLQGFQNEVSNLQNNRFVSMIVSENSNISTKLSEYLNMGITAASDYFTSVISMITNFIIIAATVPIILYYMLKESEHIPSSILHIIPSRYQRDGKKVISEIDSALSGFIVGRVWITFLLGVMTYIGFISIGLPYSLLLTLVASGLNLIPYIGPLLGAVPVLIVAFTHSPSMVFWAAIVMIVTQQIENNLLSPHIYGKNLEIHPLTTIILLLVAGEFSGIIGVILAIPAYMVFKIIITHVYRLFWAEKVEELIE
ncbi:pheromone autoinducer 2 transporter [compost metagenome]